MKRRWILQETVFVFGCVGFCIVLVVFLGFLPRGNHLHKVSAASAAEKGKKKVEAKYVGVMLCRVCHKSPKTGDQYGQWNKTKHAQAFKALRTAKSKEIAARLGIRDPQKDMKCLRCHVTAADKPEPTKKRLKASDGVQCESCHGPGEYYSKKDIFEKGREAAMQAGLVIPDKKLCVKCHNKESPTFSGEFNFEEAWKKILHPNPEKKKSKK